MTRKAKTLWNWNTRLALCLCLVSGIADSIWLDLVLSSFLFGLAKEMNKTKQENTLVGIGEAAFGISQLLFALPIGFLADKWSKAKTIRLGSVIMLLAIVSTLWAVNEGVLAEESHDSHRASNSFRVLMAAMVIWGICTGITNGPAQALFADALPASLRTEGYTYLYGVYLVAGSIGPLITVYMFNRLSNRYEDWNLAEIQPAFVLGLVLEIPVAGLMMFFKDVPVEDLEDEDEETDGVTATMASRRIPILLFVSSLVTALGSGASAKFFPLFFKDQGLSPENVQWIFVVSPLIIALFIGLALHLAGIFGRVRTSIFMETTGGVLLFLMAVLHSHHVTKWFIVVPLFLLRSGMINCTYALVESILMSSVPSNERARWKS